LRLILIPSFEGLRSLRAMRLCACGQLYD
jgi:hypothetical protein